jgi:hypothetical protein
MPLLCLPSLSKAKPLPQTYAVAPKGSEGFVLRAEASGEWDMKMRFAVFHSKSDPKMAMRGGAAGVRYNVVSWFNKDLDEKSATVRKIEDSSSVGDGFDPEILRGSTSFRTSDLFQAAPFVMVTANAVRQEGDRWIYTFPQGPDFTLRAELSLPDAGAPPVLRYELTPETDGYFSVGYLGAPAHALDGVDEIWQPLVWQEKRFPSTSYMTLAFRTTVPSAFVTRQGTTIGVVVDASEFPFTPLPLAENSRFGVAVRNQNGLAQPMTFAPVLGGIDSKMKRGERYAFTLRPVIVPGDTTRAFEYVARKLFGFRDYRTNALGSLNDTLERMIDYGMSEFSRFSEERKASGYDTDAQGTVKNVSSLDPLFLAMVTDNEDIFRHRALPVIEFMLSRGKFLFTPDRKQRTQSPSHDLTGPAAPISELTALYEIFKKGSPFLLDIAKQEYASSRVRNLDAPELGKRWQNAMALYRVTGDKDYLEFAMRDADRYIEERVKRPATDFKDPEGGQMFFWTEINPRFKLLFEMYETTGEKRYLEAAHISARRYAQMVWMSPAIPDESITVNRGGYAPHYWYLKRMGHARMKAKEESVPAWRLSEIGLTAESSHTSTGHRAIFMANFAPWMLRIGHLTGDDFLVDIARSAIIGRYRNFPGYHMNTDRTTVYEAADYPLKAHRDLGFNSMHYNHIWPMMSLVLDYLVTDAFVRSNGKIDFPSQFIEGYAYMQAKFHGNMTGRFYDADDAVLWMPKDLLHIDNPEVNYIAARGDHALHLALMNESFEPVTTTVRVDSKLVPKQAFTLRTVSDAGSASGAGAAGTFQVTIPAKGLIAVSLDGVRITPAFQHKVSGVDPDTLWSSDRIDFDDPPGRAVIMNFGTLAKSAYVYLFDGQKDFEKVTLVYDANGTAQRVTKKGFPWEFTIPLAADAKHFEFRFETIGKQASPSYRFSGARASSVSPKQAPEKAVDGIISDASRWVSAPDQEGPSWLELTLDEPNRIGRLVVVSGFQNRSPVERFVLQYKRDGAWRDIPSTRVTNNSSNSVEITIPEKERVTADAVRLFFPHEPGEIIRIKEVSIKDTDSPDRSRTSQTYRLKR